MRKEVQDIEVFRRLHFVVISRQQEIWSPELYPTLFEILQGLFIVHSTIGNE